MPFVTMLRSVLRYAVARYLATALVAVGLTLLAVWWFQPPPATITVVDKVVTTVEVPVERLTTKIVTEYVRVEDTATVAALLREVDALRVQVQQLSASLASHTSTGTGPVVVTTPTPVTPTTPAVPTTTTFKDWRLSFVSDGSTAQYTLTQQFSILNTVGTNRQGTPVNLVRLFEIGPTGERLPIPVTETLTVAAAPNQPRWYLTPTLQAGVGRTAPLSTPTVAGTNEFVVAVPWWKRGTTEAVEDTRWAVLSPALTVRGRDVTVGVLPISLNLATTMSTPFTDVWVSPFVGLSLKTQQKRVGLVFTATF